MINHGTQGNSNSFIMPKMMPTDVSTKSWITCLKNPVSCVQPVYSKHPTPKLIFWNAAEWKHQWKMMVAQSYSTLEGLTKGIHRRKNWGGKKILVKPTNKEYIHLARQRLHPKACTPWVGISFEHVAECDPDYIHHVAIIKLPTCQLYLFSANSSPVASWDRKESTGYTLEDLAGSDRSSGYFCLPF